MRTKFSRLFLALIVALVVTFALGTFPAVAHARVSTQVQRANADGLGKLTIKNGVGSAAEVKVIDTSTNSVVYKVDIPSGQDDTITGIADGTYVIAFWSGTPSGGFGKKFKDPLVYKTTQTDQGVKYTIWTVTLYTVVNGNAPTDNISRGDFDSM